MEFYYSVGDQQKGPVSADDLRAAGVGPDTLVWREGMSEWTRAGSVPELAKLFAPTPSHAPSAPFSPVATGYTPSPQQGQPPAPGFPPAGPQQLEYPSPAPFGGAVTPSNPGMGLAVASLVLGIISMPIAILCACASWLSFPFAIVAIVLGHIGLAQSKKATGKGNGMAVAGLICGYLALLVAILWMVWIHTMMNTTSNQLRQIQQQQQQQGW